MLESYSKNLSIKIVEQKEGKIEEAVNLIYSNAKGEILITLDDDNIPSETWVEDHLKSHELYPRFGALRGKITKTREIKHPLGHKLRNLLKQLVYRPYSKDLAGYVGYLTQYGIPTDIGRPPHSKVIKTITLSSENTSIKREVYHDLKLPGYTFRGFHHEDILALHAIKKGFFTGEITDGAVNMRVEREEYGAPSLTLSKPKDLKGKLELTIEHFLFPYAANLMGYKPRGLTTLRLMVSLSRVGLYRRAALAGIDLAIEGIENRLSPSEIRERLRDAVKGLEQLSLSS
ncbi:conserved hypothetical protein [Metallosphaera cuprina Ar-4]|uniref:Glycosyltransferase 2-like domain-containing protein n=2 Tax=Metallosphaera TaxID=41980 RepID=F4G2K3_METCR|nr:conserved hypothetical protein [Metallosphaera cuprina Ar-4]